ncbi:MFS transporter [Streptomyces sp. ARC32]
MSLTLPQLLQSPTATGYGLGQSVLAAGLALAPGGLVMMALSPISARVSARYGPRTSLLAGVAVIGVGYGAGMLLMSQVWQIVVTSMIISAGVGIAYAAMPALIMDSVPVTETASANGVNALMRSVGTSTASAVMAAILANMTMKLGPAQIPTESGFRMTYLVAIGATVAGLLLTLAIPRARATARHAARNSGSEQSLPADVPATAGKH